MFSLEPSLPAVDPAWHLTQMDVDTGATKYDLYLELDERRDAVLARFHYSTDLFDQATIVRMSEHWTRTARSGALEMPACGFRSCRCSSEEERRQVVEEWNRNCGRVSAEHKTIHKVFDAQCAADAGSNCSERRKESNSAFDNFRSSSNRLAHYLHKFGAGPGTRVALCVDRSCDMLVGLLGILKTGAAYVPLDPSYPPDRIRFMLEDADPVVLVTQRKLLAKIPTHRATSGDDRRRLEQDCVAKARSLQLPISNRATQPTFCTRRGRAGNRRGWKGRMEER